MKKYIIKQKGVTLVAPTAKAAIEGAKTLGLDKFTFECTRCGKCKKPCK
jgi:hypothetical protein